VPLASFPLILVQPLLLLLLLLLCFFHQKNLQSPSQKKKGIDFHLPAKVIDFGLTSVCKQTQSKKTAKCKQVTRGKYGLLHLLYPEQELGWTAMAGDSK
jgi:hypothetical protein